MNSFAEGFAVGQSNSNNGWNNFGGEGLLWIILLFALLGGNGGWGNGWNNNGGGQMGYDIGKLATTNDVASGFTNSSILSNQREQALVLSNMQNYINQGFSGLNVQLLTGFNDVSRQISDCCCQTQRAIDNVNFNMERNTCDLKQTINYQGDRIIGFLTNKEIESLRECNTQLRAENRWLREKDERNQQTGILLSAIRNNDGCGCCNSYQY